MGDMETLELIGIMAGGCDDTCCGDTDTCW